jgi:hypothetical protein
MTKAISYRRMWRLDQILQSRFGWDICYLLDVGSRDGEHHSRAGVKLAEFIREDEVDGVFDCLFGDEDIDATTMWSLLALPGQMPPVTSRSGRNGRRGMTVADILAARKAPVAAPAPAPVVAVAPAPVAAVVAPAPDPMMAQILQLMQAMQATNEALASRLTALENELGVDANLPPAAPPVQEEPVVEDAQEDTVEDTQEEPEAIEAF